MFSVQRPVVRMMVNSLCAIVVTVSLVTTTMGAQPKAKGKIPAKGSAAPKPALLIGTWVGTATVPLKDSSLVVPVTYTFTQSGTVIAGTAMVPGQGSGPIANVVRDGTHLKFRVTAPEGKLLEHDGTFSTDGSIEGMVNLDNLPVAKFKIAPRK